MVAIEPEDTLELQKRKKAWKTRSSGATSTMDLDASQRLKGVNKEDKFNGGLENQICRNCNFAKLNCS